MQGACAWSLGVCRTGPEQGAKKWLGVRASRGTAQESVATKACEQGCVAISSMFASVMTWDGEWAGSRWDPPLPLMTHLSSLPTLPPRIPTKSSPWTGLTPPSSSSLAPIAHLSPNSNLRPHYLQRRHHNPETSSVSPLNQLSPKWLLPPNRPLALRSSLNRPSKHTSQSVHGKGKESWP